MIDWHCHLLPGVDDGSKNFDESLAMGRLLIEAGFTEVYCTPHCLHGAYDNTPQRVQQATASLQQAFQEADLNLRLHPGMEYYLDEMFIQNIDQVQPLGDTRLVLVEAPQQARPEVLTDALFQLRRHKWIPVIAHPERCILFDQACSGRDVSAATLLGKLWPFRKKSSPQGMPVKQTFLQVLVNMGCRFQGNISSFAGLYGPEVRQQAHAHLICGLYDYFGTDGHDARSLKRNLSRGLEKLAEAKASGNPKESSCKL